MNKKETEAAISNHADWIEHLAGRMDELAAAQTKTEEQIEKTSAAIERLTAQQAETDKRLRELGEATDKRIGDLVSAIGAALPERKQ